MLKFNLNPYMTKDYTRNSEFRPMQKQTQTNPNLSAYGGQTQNLLAIRGAKPIKAKLVRHSVWRVYSPFCVARRSGSQKIYIVMRTYFCNIAFFICKF
jgi:hypothetical protein